MKAHVYILHPDPSKLEEAVLMFSVTRRGEFLDCGHDDTLLIPIRHGDEALERLQCELMRRESRAHCGPVRATIDGQHYLLNRRVWQDLSRALFEFDIAVALGDAGSYGELH